jgi:hypothetical protein
MQVAQPLAFSSPAGFKQGQLVVLGHLFEVLNLATHKDSAKDVVSQAPRGCCSTPLAMRQVRTCCKSSCDSKGCLCKL